VTNEPDGVYLPPAKVAWVLAAAMAALICAHLVFVYIKYFLPDYYFDFFQFFDVDRERSYPTVFSTFLFMLNGILLFAAWHFDRSLPRSRAWLLLSGIFFFLMFDEFGGIHERTADFMDHALGDLGVANIAWIFLYAPLIVLLSLFLLRWFLNLDANLRKRLILSAAVFLGGAIGVELIEGYHQRQMNMEEDLIRQLICTVEETFEMSGLILLTWTLLKYFKDRKGYYSIRI
jgi:hypothetical protein